MTSSIFDVVGVGVGPTNLSLAALLARAPELSARFYEQKPQFSWHPGMMLANTRMQTSFLKDLVTPVDPTSPYSFLAYLVAKGRFYRFLNADFARVRRIEFVDYMRWASEQLDSLSFGRSVESVRFDGQSFALTMRDGEEARAKNLVLGIGLHSHVPSWAEPHLGARVVHSEDFMAGKVQLEGRRVAVVGGGQSGAEIFLDIMQGANGRPSEVSWISRRPNLEPLDETPFTNEYFTPDYVRSFHRLSPQNRSHLVHSQKLAGDGVSPETLRDLSQLLYEYDFLHPCPWSYRVLTHRDVRALKRASGVFQLHMRNGFQQTDEVLAVDTIVLATGYRYRLPAFLGSLASRIEHDADGCPKLQEDYSVRWDGPSQRRIYMQNAGRNSHGIADPQLSLAAWRASVIANSLAGRELYATTPHPPPVRWANTGLPSPVRHPFEEAELR
ncbi:MAG: SidA/IucD/PvdA family monooxygenase [Polyangiales bacterium]